MPYFRGSPCGTLQLHVWRPFASLILGPSPARPTPELELPLVLPGDPARPAALPRWKAPTAEPRVLLIFG